MSLRGRILVVTVALFLVGLGAAGFTTYYLLSSFLVDRVDDQLQASTRQVAAELTRTAPPHTGEHDRFLPDGTYAALVDERGQVRREAGFAFGQNAPRPVIPRELIRSLASDGEPMLTTAPAVSGQTEFRLIAKPLGGEGTVVVAVPLTEVRATERRLLLIGGVVSGLVVVAIGVAAYWLTRRELRPLERMAERSGAIAVGDLSQRVEPDDPRTEVGRLGGALNAMLGEIEGPASLGAVQAALDPDRAGPVGRHDRPGPAGRRPAQPASRPGAGQPQQPADDPRPRGVPGRALRRPARGATGHRRDSPRDDPADLPPHPTARSRRLGEGLGERAGRGGVRAGRRSRRGCRGGGGASGPRDRPAAGRRRLRAPGRREHGGCGAVGGDRRRGGRARPRPGADRGRHLRVAAVRRGPAGRRSRRPRRRLQVPARLGRRSDQRAGARDAAGTDGRPGAARRVCGGRGSLRCVRHRQDAAVVATPPIDAEPFALDGLGPTIGCHDVGVFMPLHLAAVACLSEAQLWDISDPLHPRTLAHIQEPVAGFEIWHSATWTWDGKYIVFGDESESGSCHADQSEMDGRVWFYRLSDLRSGVTAPVGSFLIPRDQAGEYCSAHMFNVVPVKDRYLLTSSWYGGGTDVIDFTDPAHASEIAYYDVESPNQGSFWAAYWYNGFIYGSDIPNGFDAFLFNGPQRAGAQQLGHLNPQTQETYLR